MRAWLALIVPLSLFLAAPASAANDHPQREWQQLDDPADHGWSEGGLSAVDDYVNEIASTSVIIVQHGVIVQSWGDIAHPSNLHSCRKSLLSALIGIAVERGDIDLDDTLDDLGIDDKPPSLSEAEEQATVRDLLKARSGVYHGAAYETQAMKDSRPRRGAHAPGTFWYYNNWDFNALGRIYEQETGSRIFDAFDREIGRPVGMQDFKPADGHYFYDSVSDFPAYLFNMSARDFARFALLYLHQGRWGNAQIVPRDWVRESTRPWSDAPTGGYGYLWWTADSATPTHRSNWFPAGSYYAEGVQGQYAVIVPSRDLVIVNRVDEAQTSDSVARDEMAKLVRLVLAAAPRD